MCVIIIFFHTASNMGLIFKFCRKKNKKPCDVKAQSYGYGSGPLDNTNRCEKSGDTCVTTASSTLPGVSQFGRTPLRSSLKSTSCRTESESSRNGYTDIASGEFSANSSKGHVRFNTDLPTLSGDLPPHDGRTNKPHPHLAHQTYKSHHQNEKYIRPPPKPQGLSWYPNFGKKNGRQWRWRPNNNGYQSKYIR